ncbi:hypothetical protein H2O64_14765 [Kordia sp. YSTF-M3]|uniref:Bacteriocin n=1 Tax=Kordia aestuariivivens TaxID=2759037 RepID=A0ABR7QBS5_9FLAO|nr:hypothetical protein [Kordia aestuariivivens]MBC8755938.1 hypothetical protein [Kordia aestuariivivens]
MKKKNLKTLSLTKATISNLQTISGGTDITIAIIRTIQEVTATGCSELMKCDSVAACPRGVGKTKFVDTDTNPASLCMDGYR